MRLFYVTGSDRCGTTWISEMIAENYGIPYFHEPFHIGIDHPFDLTGLVTIGKVRQRTPMNPELDWILNYLEVAVDYLGDMVLKDFFGLFAADEIEKIGFKVVVVVRHPAPASMSSYYSGWDIQPYYDLIGYPAALRAVMPHLDHIYQRDDLWWRAWMLWAIRYLTIRKLGFTNWVVHENMCLTPVRELFQKTGIKMTEKGMKFFRESNRKPTWKNQFPERRRLTKKEPFKWFGKFDRLREMEEALDPFNVKSWGLWDSKFWSDGQGWYVR